MKIANMFKKQFTQDRLEELQHGHYWYLETDSFLNMCSKYIADEIDALSSGFSVLEMGSNRGSFLSVLKDTHPYIGLEGSEIAIRDAIKVWGSRPNTKMLLCRFEDIVDLDIDIRADVVFFANVLLYFKPECVEDFIDIVLKKAQAKYFVICTCRTGIATKRHRCLGWKAFELSIPGLTGLARNRKVSFYAVS